MEWTDEQRAAFAELFRTARERTGLKQYEVADRLGMAHGTISQLERGPFMGMRWWDVVRLAKFYNLPQDLIETALGLVDRPEAAEELEEFVLHAEMAGLSFEQREQVRSIARLVIKGLQAKG